MSAFGAVIAIMAMIYGTITQFRYLFRRSPYRIELSDRGLDDNTISSAPIPWRDVELILAHPIHPTGLAKRASSNVEPALSPEDTVLIIQLSENAWKSGTINKLHRDKRRSLIRSFGADGILIHPSSYGKDADELRSTLESYKTRFG